MIQAPNWQDVETILFEKSKETIERFAKEHPDLMCSFFAYDTDPSYGYFLPSFDTPENSLQQAQKNEQRAIERRQKMLSQEWSWKSASYMSKSPRVTDYSSDVSCFAYHIYADFRFPELTRFKESDNYPQRMNEIEDDYLEGHVRLLLWKIIEQLIANNVFSQLHLASPFRIGYQFHEEDLLVFRILNWPSPKISL